MADRPRTPNFRQGERVHLTPAIVERFARFHRRDPTVFQHILDDGNLHDASVPSLAECRAAGCEDLHGLMYRLSRTQRGRLGHLVDEWIDVHPEPSFRVVVRIQP